VDLAAASAQLAEQARAWGRGSSQAARSGAAISFCSRGRGREAQGAGRWARASKVARRLAWGRARLPLGSRGRRHLGERSRRPRGRVAACAALQAVSWRAEASNRAGVPCISQRARAARHAAQERLCCSPNCCRGAAGSPACVACCAVDKRPSGEAPRARCRAVSRGRRTLECVVWRRAARGRRMGAGPAFLGDVMRLWQELHAYPSSAVQSPRGTCRTCGAPASSECGGHLCRWPCIISSPPVLNTRSEQPDKKWKKNLFTHMAQQVSGQGCSSLNATIEICRDPCKGCRGCTRQDARVLVSSIAVGGPQQHGFWQLDPTEQACGCIGRRRGPGRRRISVPA